MFRFFKEIASGRFKGHPIHVMFVHYPIGLFSAGFFLDLTTLWLDINHLPLVSFYCMAGGAAGGLAAMLFGMIDYLKLAKEESLYKKAGWHALLQLTAFILFITVLVLKLPDYPHISYPTPVMLILETLAFSAMTAGNYIGGDLVYKYGAGTSAEIRQKT
ncbi:MAG: DUF2231 domain-containing protein [Balneolaceae bacterium]